MDIILFTMIELDRKLNPYRQAGIIHNEGLDALVTGIGSTDAATLATDFIFANYSTYVTYGGQVVDPTNVMGYNTAITPTVLAPTNTLLDIDLKGGYNEWVERVFSFINDFPPVIAPNTMERSFLIFASYDDVFFKKSEELLNRILDSGVPANQNALALIAHAVLTHSYDYWRNVYITGSGNPWYDFIAGMIGDVDEINWRMLIQQDIKGALQGAVAYANNIDNVDGTLIIGAAGGGMAASAQNLLLQAGYISFYSPPA